MLIVRIFLLGLFLRIARSLSCQYQKCSYFGDPHLIGYGSSTQYWCKKQGWELLNSNAYVNVYVKVGASPYLITDYVITFPGTVPCVLIDHASVFFPFSTVCPAASPVTTFVITPGSRWIHFHKQTCLIIDVRKQWGYFDIHIFQSSSLVASTKGVCVKRNCTVESSWPGPKPIIPQICQVFVAHAQKNALVQVAGATIKATTMSCINDLQITFDARFALQVVDVIFQQSALSLLTGGIRYDQGIFRKLNVAAMTAIANGISEANQIIRRTEDVCDERYQICIRPFEDTSTSQTVITNNATFSWLKEQ